ncbi:CAP domain-containing protein [Bacillus dakarensis]|uniref:CAP domain-containing protein n=1 Tax=Robertmurraya dakarensis TaxID=1926278 RepID=UPI001F24EF47|nr:CAP domain-containing protein [Bacillus dakarensis]
MKGLKVFLIGCLILFLAACNQNAGDSAGQQVQRENDLQQVGNRNGLEQSGRRNLEDRTSQVRHNNQNDQRRNNNVPNDAIQRINNGFITIEQNSYSTTIPSSKFPHSKYITEGQFEFYLNENEKNQSQYQQGKAEAGRTPESQQPDRGQAPANEPEAQRPDREQAPANEPAPQQPRNEQAPANEQAPQQDLQTQGITQTEQRVIELTNAERRKNGLSDLQADTSLSNVAREKSRDMQQNNYFSHTSPTYGSPFDMMRDFGVNYQSAGENIAKGQRSPEEVVNAWMNSEGHRKNILSSDYTHIGVGHNQNGNYWTQMFIKK